MESQKEVRIHKIKKENETSFVKDTIKYKLKYFGDDLTDHEGIEWIYLLCPYCNTYTLFKPHTTIIVDCGEMEDISTRYFHTLAICEHCNDVVYIKFFEHDFDPDWWFDYEFHYPCAFFDVTVPIIPEFVRESFSEAYTCLQVGAFLAVLVMCRRTIESLLDEKGIPNKPPLAKRIELLSQKGILPETIINIADLVRLIGNIGAHSSNEKFDKKKNATEAFELTQRLIETVYILPEKIRKMKDEIKKK